MVGQQESSPCRGGAARVDLACTCWRGLCFAHPADWEEAALSDFQESGKAVLVDRRFQRMQVQWERLNRPPDLEAMHAKLKDSFPQHAIARLTTHPNWIGLVRTDPGGQVVHAGRFLQNAGGGKAASGGTANGTLVQVVITWPGQRDEPLEAAILDSVAAQQGQAMVHWEALGLHVQVPGEFELAESSSRVGRVVWTFLRKKPGLPRDDTPGPGATGPASIMIERLALPKYWLKTKLEEWLTTQQPPGFRIAAAEQVQLPSHAAVRIHARHGGRVADLVRRTEHRLGWAWLCHQQQRIYHVAVRYRGHRAPALPEVLVHCCQDVKIGPSVF